MLRHCCAGSGVRGLAFDVRRTASGARSCKVRRAFAASQKAVLIYRRTGNLRAVQLLLGRSKSESTVRSLGIEVDDAIEIAEKIDI